MAPPEPVLTEELHVPLTVHDLDHEVFWAPRARVDLAAGGIVAELAPAGHQRIVESVVLPWQHLEEWEAVDVASVVGRRFRRRRDGTLEMLPRQLTGPRPLLLAETRAVRPYGDRALDGASGYRLAYALGIPLGMLLQSYETACLIEPGERVETALRRLDEDGTLDGRVVVVVGARTCHLVAHGRDLDGRVREFGGRLAGVVPHPSGRGGSLAWNLTPAAEEARQLLVDVLMSVRGVPSDDREATLLAAAAARVGRWLGWQRLAELGIASHSPIPGHAWRPEIHAGALRWVRRWRAGEAYVERQDRNWIVHVSSSESHYFKISSCESLAHGIGIAEAFAACHARRFLEVANREEVSW